MNATLQVESATVWNSVPNVVENVNDRIEIFGPNTSGTGTQYVITFPQGLYNLEQINATLEYDLRDAGAKTTTGPLVFFTANEASNKVEIHFNYAATTARFSAASQARTMREILGFSDADITLAGTAPETQLAPSIAALNNVDYFLIHSDLTNTGIRVNNKYSQTIAQVLIDVLPGSQIVSQPNHPPKSEIQALVGSTRTHIRVWITDQANNAVNTSGEDFSVRLVLKYDVPYVFK